MEIHLTVILSILIIVYFMGLCDLTIGSMNIIDDCSATNISVCTSCVTSISVEVRCCPWFRKMDDYINPKIIAYTNVYILTISNFKTETRNQEITSLFLSTYRYLRNLSIISSQATYISQNAFNELTDLEYLNLKNNCITTLPSNLFQKTIKLKWLSLASNKIKTLPERIFEPVAELKYLDLSYNLLEDINT